MLANEVFTLADASFIEAMRARGHVFLDFSVLGTRAHALRCCRSTPSSPRLSHRPLGCCWAAVRTGLSGGAVLWAGSQKRRFRLVTAWSSTAEAADLLLADAAEIGAEATAQARL